MAAGVPRAGVLVLALQLVACAQQIPADGALQGSPSAKPSAPAPVEAVTAAAAEFAVAAPAPENVSPETAAPATEAAAPEVGRGLASWYGPRFHGRRTASGERFDMHALTAAHPSLPFGSIVRVENPDTGRSVDVRINDRGPHIKQRIIDLSRAAARALGLLDSGHGTNAVVLKLLKRPD
jgi:rare lipoprotein A